MDLGIAVNLGSGGEQKPGVLREGEAEGVVGAERSDLQGLNGVLEIINRAGGAGQVKYCVHGSVHLNMIAHVVLNESEQLAAERQKIIVMGPSPGEEIIHANDFIAAVQECIA